MRKELAQFLAWLHNAGEPITGAQVNLIGLLSVAVLALPAGAVYGLMKGTGGAAVVLTVPASSRP